MTERSILIDIARQLHSALGNLQNEDPEDDDDEDQIVCCMKDFLEDEATDDLRQDLDKDHPVSSILDLVEKLVKAHSHREDINAVSTMDDGYDSDVYEEYEEPAATCEDAGGEGGKVHSEDDDKDPMMTMEATIMGETTLNFNPIIRLSIPTTHQLPSTKHTEHRASWSCMTNWKFGVGMEMALIILRT